MSLPAFLAERLRLPLICSPLFIISQPDLVIAQCKAGVVGSFPSLNARPLSLLDEWLHRITEELAAWDHANPDRLSAPFAVNQIVHRSNARLEQDMELCAKYRVPLVITSLGAREDVNRAVHDWGGLAFHDVIDDRFARKAVEKGADGLIPVATGAGGHAGQLSPFALVQEIRRWFAGPVALSGAIANGHAILAAQAMGADLAYIGSLFIATDEARADEAYKQMIVDSAAKDIVYSNLFTGVHGNYLGPSIARAGLDPANLPESDPSKMDFGSAGSSEAKAWRDVWGCGQGIGTVDSIEPAAMVVARLVREYEAAKVSLDARFVTPREGGPAIQSGDRVRLVEEIGLRSRRAASGLRSMGVGEGDCIALLLRNDFAFFEATAAAEQLGAYPVPINWHSTAEEVRYILDDCGAKVLVAHRDLLAAIADAVPPVVTVLTVETPAELLAAYRVAAPARTPEHPLWDGWLSRHAALDAAPHVGNSAVIYTSGTTGKPKGVKRMPDTHGTMTRAAATGYGLLLEGAKVVLINGPMYHSAPNSYARFAMAVGASIVLQPRFDAEQLLAMIEQHRVTHMHIVPTMFVRLLRLPDAVKRRYELSSLRFVVHGAAPCPSEIKRAMIDWWGPVIHEYYGSTETGLVAGHNSKEALDRPGTVGRPFDMVTLRILDDTGRVLAAGETGDIYVRSADAPVFDYIGRTDERREIEREGFITVGDVGYQDADGYLFLCDRKRDMIISGGVNIYPAEIEAALHALPEVRDCAVFGIPDAEFGEAVCACVQPVEGAAIDVDLLRTALAARLSRFKIPRVIDLVDTLPREDSGKIFKRKLRERYSPRA